jgi:hypothetical protein
VRGMVWAWVGDLRRYELPLLREEFDEYIQSDDVSVRNRVGNQETYCLIYKLSRVRGLWRFAKWKKRNGILNKTFKILYYGLV